MTWQIALGLAVMAGVTYLIRAVPFVAFRKKIRSPFVRALLGYVPYAVLGAMTVPHALYATGDILSAAVGLTVALVLALLRRSLLVVALSGCAGALVCMGIELLL